MLFSFASRLFFNDKSFKRLVPSAVASKTLIRSVHVGVLQRTMRRWWELELQTALIPLYVVSKICCVNAYTYRRMPSRDMTGEIGKPTGVPSSPANHVVVTLSDAFVGSSQSDDSPGKVGPSSPSVVLEFSAAGVLHAVGCSAAYAAYHIVSSLSQSSKLTDPNLVRVAIDLKNQYMGCILVLALVGVSLFRQPTVDALLRTILRVEDELGDIRHGLPGGLQAPLVGNTAWLRNVFLMLVAGVGVKAVLEISNCLMYIRDSGSPFSSYCLVLCIVPQTICIVCELQSVAYALLLRQRFGQLNRWLRQLQPHLARGSGPAFRSLGRIAATHSDLTGAIKLLGRSFGVQNAILLLNQFVTLVELGYNTCMMTVRFDEAETQQDDSTEDFLETVIWVGWFVLEIFVLCYFSHVTVEEVSQDYMILLNKQINITCCDLFNVDLALLYAIIGATSTYLIILIQFDQSFNE
uniref:Gustatory receptor n=1 Tax=Anopheles atroparvus TaxID=41427 RepID=A0A182J5U1_ANOAO